MPTYGEIELVSWVQEPQREEPGQLTAEGVVCGVVEDAAPGAYARRLALVERYAAQRAEAAERDRAKLAADVVASLVRMNRAEGIRLNPRS